MPIESDLSRDCLIRGLVVDVRVVRRGRDQSMG
jgi:hypothetical protein